MTSAHNSEVPVLTEAAAESTDDVRSHDKDSRFHVDSKTVFDGDSCSLDQALVKAKSVPLLSLEGVALRRVLHRMYTKNMYQKNERLYQHIFSSHGTGVWVQEVLVVGEDLDGAARRIGREKLTGEEARIRLGLVLLLQKDDQSVFDTSAIIEDTGQWLRVNYPNTNRDMKRYLRSTTPYRDQLVAEGFTGMPHVRRQIADPEAGPSPFSGYAASKKIDFRETLANFSLGACFDKDYRHALPFADEYQKQLSTRIALDMAPYHQRGRQELMEKCSSPFSTAKMFIVSTEKAMALPPLPHTALGVARRGKKKAENGASRSAFVYRVLLEAALWARARALPFPENLPVLIHAFDRYHYVLRDCPVFCLFKPENENGILCPDDSFIRDSPTHEEMQWVGSVYAQDAGDKWGWELWQDVLSRVPQAGYTANDLYFCGPSTDDSVGGTRKIMNSHRTQVIQCGSDRLLGRGQVLNNVNAHRDAKCTCMSEWGSHRFLLDLPGRGPWSYRFKYILLMNRVVVRVAQETVYGHGEHHSAPVNFFSGVLQAGRTHLDCPFVHHDSSSVQRDTEHGNDPTDDAAGDTGKAHVSDLCTDVAKTIDKVACDEEKETRMAKAGCAAMMNLTKDRIMQYVYECLVAYARMLHNGSREEAVPGPMVDLSEVRRELEKLKQKYNKPVTRHSTPVSEIRGRCSPWSNTHVKPDAATCISRSANVSWRTRADKLPVADPRKLARAGPSRADISKRWRAGPMSSGATRTNGKHENTPAAVAWNQNLSGTCPSGRFVLDGRVTGTWTSSHAESYRRDIPIHQRVQQAQPVGTSQCRDNECLEREQTARMGAPLPAGYRDIDSRGHEEPALSTHNAHYDEDGPPRRRGRRGGRGRPRQPSRPSQREHGIPTPEDVDSPWTDELAQTGVRVCYGWHYACAISTTGAQTQRGLR